MFWCKYYPTKKWETEGFAKMPAELRKRYLKQKEGQWMIIGKRMASGESKPSASRRSGRQGSKKTQIAAGADDCGSTRGAVGVGSGWCSCDV